MSEYLLPCSCGQKVPVSARHAGHTVRCACGAELEVPTLRGLRELEPVAPREATHHAWGDRQRVAFVLATVAVAAVAVIGYLTYQLPEKPVRPEIPDVTQDTPLGEALLVYAELQRGIDAEPPVLTPAGEAVVARHNRMLWGIAVAAVIAVVTSVGTAVVLFGGRQKR